MRGKRFYAILIGLITVGIISVVVFRKQQEEKYVAFEGYEITAITDRVDNLYNEDKTDIVENIADDELEAIDKILFDLKEKDFSSKNERHLEETTVEFMAAREMREIQREIRELFIEDEIIDQKVTMPQVEALKEKLDPYEATTLFFERNTIAIEDAHLQVTTITTAASFVADLFEEDEVVVRKDITREDETEALELIKPIKNEVVKEELTNKIELVDIALTEMEEALAVEAELEALEEVKDSEETEESEEEGVEEKMEEAPEYTAPDNERENSGSASNPWSTPRTPSSSGTETGSSSGRTRSSGGGSSGTQNDPYTERNEPDSAIEPTEEEEDTHFPVEDDEGEQEEPVPSIPEIPEEPTDPVDSEDAAEPDPENIEEP